jgi:2-oxoglutarate ferredoxin oxidoreductase subunit beta
LGDVKQYLRKQTFPHIWCPGCGNGIILYTILSAIDKLGLDKDKVTMVSGIGCSSRAPGYVDFNTLHTTHGRALPFATGIKLAKPEMTVIVVTGDGDATAIGGNHLIHAARRNIDMTVVVFNNSTYGMTSGQYSPATPTGAFGTTAPYGNVERPFDICRLAEAAGATYVARGTAYHAKVLPNLIEKAITNKGFSVVEAVTQCPIYFGKMNKIGNAVEMMKWQREHAVSKKEASTMSPEEMTGKFTIGELYNNPAPEYCEQYEKIIAKAQGKG